MTSNAQLRDAADAVLSAGSMQQSIASIRGSIRQLLDPSGCLDGLTSEESFKVAWTVAASAGALVSGVNALLRSFEGLAPEAMIDATRGLIGRFGDHAAGGPAELLADRDRLLGELQVLLTSLTAVVRQRAAHAPTGALLRDADFSALLG
jgi:hypothetical protein